jgi:hypothetical protein
MNEENCKKMIGIYKGIVVSNIDPYKQGRLLVNVPDVLDQACIWAESASPLVGPQMGIYLVPPPGSGVWILFQGGDPNYAVWTGCWRGSATDVPAKASLDPPTNPPILIQSITQNKIEISSVPGKGIVIETALGEAGPRIVVDNTGITISTGPEGLGASIKLQGKSVNINNNALTII